MEVVTAGAQDELMQSLDYKLKTSNTSYVTARHDLQCFPSSLSLFSPTTSSRIPLTSGTSFINPKSIKIAFRVRNTDGTNPLAPATPNPACFVQRAQVFDNGQRCDDINNYGRAVTRTCCCAHHGGHPALREDAPPQLNLVIEIAFADAAAALWSENAGAHPAEATRSTDFEIQNVRVLAFQVVLDSALDGAVQRFERRGGAQRHRGARLYETHGRVCNLLGQQRGLQDPLAGKCGADVAPIGAARQENSLRADAAGQPAVPSQPHKGSLGSTDLVPASRSQVCLREQQGQTVAYRVSTPFHLHSLRRSLLCVAPAAAQPRGQL